MLFSNYKNNKVAVELWTLIRMFFYLACATFLLFLLTGIIIAKLQPELDKKPPSIMGATSSLPKNFFVDILRMEIPHFQKNNSDPYTFTRNNVISFITEILLDVNIMSPKSLIASTIPNMQPQQTFVLYKGHEHDDFPIDNIEPSNNKSSDLGGTGVNVEADIIKSDPENDHSIINRSDTQRQYSASTKTNKLLIYHTHNRESWLPELPLVKKPELAFDKTKNVTLLGSRLKKKLEESGIGSIHSDVDYNTSIKGFSGRKAYDYSQTLIKEVQAAQNDIKYLIDIHRDAGPRRATTITYNGQDYAQIYFVVGVENKNWRENQDFAKRISDLADKKIPGISKGIFGKRYSDGNGVYNQDLSPWSCLIEVGGVENTIEESYRTIDILAEVFAEIIHEENNSIKS